MSHLRPRSGLRSQRRVSPRSRARARGRSPRRPRRRVRHRNQEPQPGTRPQGARRLEHSCSRAEEDGFSVLHQGCGSLSDAQFLLGLFILALQDGLFRRLADRDRTAVHTLDLPLGCQHFKIAPGSGFTDRKMLAHFRNFYPLAAQDELPDLFLTLETGDRIVQLIAHNRSNSITTNHILAWLGRDFK